MAQRLEGLELHGYKTFASKTSFTFPDKITAVVGPNGSGKSNIADSIRWVLGEQAYSLLRGKKTEDMIYSGSAQRAKMGMASATIRFNNEDNWLPIDYERVDITRRAYRNGENEYLINEKKVRLRDIQELLANSGLSERTYTIIGQGLVDSALSLKPQDRRLFFEEAAGIRLFRARREEAIRKLDKTVDNMARVQDILHEIKPRMQRLEKQVQKSKEYNRVNADLHLLLKDWYGYRWNELQRDYRESLEAKIKKETELNSVKANVFTGDEEITANRRNLQEKREVLTKLNDELSLCQREKETINRELAIIEERFKGYEEQRDSLRSSLAYAEEELKNRNEQKIALEKQHDEHGTSLKTIQTDLLGLEDSLNQKKNELQKIKGKIEELQQNKLGIDRSLAGNQAKITDLDTRIDILIKRRTELESTLKDLEEKIQEITNDVHDIQTLFDEKQAEIQKEENALQDLLNQKDKIDSSIHDLERQIQKNRNDTTAKETQRDVLQAAKKNLEGFKTGTKKILHSFQQKKLPGSYELLLSCLRVENGYEKAVSAILGDTAEGLVLDSAVDLQHVLSIIQDAGDSHSIIIPKALLRAEQKASGKELEGCRPLNNFIKTTAEYRTLMNILFADTYVLEDSKKLEEVLQKLETNQRVVLKDGGIFYGNGIISVGGTTSEFIFKREKEIDALNEDILTLAKSFQTFEKDLQKLQLTSRELQEKTDAKRQVIASRQSELSSIQKALKEVQEKQAETSQNMRLNRELVSKLVVDITEAIENKERIKLTIKDLQAKTESVQRELDEQSKLADTISLEELNQEYYQKKTEFAVIQESFESSNNRLQDALRLIRGLERQCLDFKEKIRSLEEQHSSLMEKYEQFTRRSEELNGQIQELTEQSSPIDKEIRIINEAIENKQKNAEELRKNQSIIERHFIQLEMRVEKINTQMEALKERISDDFGLVSYDYEPDMIGPKPLPIDGMVASLPKVTSISADMEDQIRSLKSTIRRIGAVNPEAEKEYNEDKERYEFLTNQIADLEQAEKDLRKVVVELEEIIKEKFKETFKAVNEEFSEIFKQLFGGGSARLIIEDEENITETGIEIEATLPGKRKQELALLSGGERSLTAIALIFSLLKISPTPFCVLDEVDAMLDESNVVRLGQLMKELSDRTQFIVITHNRNTVQLASVIYGVTMGRDSASQLISLKLEEVTDDLVE